MPLCPVSAELQRYVDWGDLAGFVTLIARNGSILEFAASGWADLATKRPMETAALFWVASITKPITAAAVLALVAEGRVALSDPIEKHLPEFRNLWMVSERTMDRLVLGRPTRSVTVRDLLIHTHGLEDPPPPAQGTSLAESVASVARGALQFEPGTRWAYGNAGMNTLGRLVEVVAERPFAEFLQTRFFTPLGMTNTTFHPDAAALQTLAKSYRRPAEWGPLEEVGISLLNGNPAKQEQTVFPGGGLFSTAEDIFRFYQMLLNGGEFEGRRYLPKTIVREMLTPQTGDLAAGFSAGMAWGLGLGIVRQPTGWTEMLPVGTWGHDGAYGNNVMAEPRSGLLFILMIQRAGLNPYQDGLKFRHAFHAAVMRNFGHEG